MKLWDIEKGGGNLTFIKTGCGAPPVLDALLPLGLTSCQRILFLSSVGSLDPLIGIGDLVLPEYAVSGDGVSRYIAPGGLNRDIFGEKSCPDPALFQLLVSETETICKREQIRWHLGRPFCTDTILVQYSYIDYFRQQGCNTVDMETAAAFRAASMMRLPLAALLCVSDNTVAKQSLMNQREQKDMNYRQFVRSQILPQIILRVIQADEHTKKETF